MVRNKVGTAELEDLSGKAATFVRGVAECLIKFDTQHPGKRIALRAIQTAGVEAVEEGGDTISVPYLSQLTAKVERAGAFEKIQKGKSYSVLPLDLNRLKTLVANEEYGKPRDNEYTLSEIQDRSKVLAHLEEHQAILIEAAHPISKAGYKVLMEKFKRGELTMAFITPDAVSEGIGTQDMYDLHTSVSDQNDA